MDETCELRQCWGFQCQEKLDDVCVVVDSDRAQCTRARRSTGGCLVFWGKHLLDSCCQQQHTISLSSTEAELHEVVYGASRGLLVRNVLQAVELEAVVRVGTDSSAAAGITQRLSAGRVEASEGQGLVDTRKRSGHMHSRSLEWSQRTIEQTC